MRSPLLLACLFALATGAGAATTASPPYGVVGQLRLGGEGKWDYPSIDPASRRLYLSRATHVMVADADSGQIVGEIANTPGVHGIAVAGDLGVGFISVGKADAVKVFNLRTQAIVADLKAGSKPDAIVYDAQSHQVFAFNGHSNNVTVIDAKALTVTATVPLGGAPEFARADGSGSVFVNLESTNELAVLDTRQLKVKARWPLPGCEGPTGLALDAPHHRSFSVCANGKMSILDTLTGKPIVTLPIGQRSDGAAFDEARQDAYSANGDGTLTVVHENDADHFTVAQILQTAIGARTIALDDQSHKLYLPTASFGRAASLKEEGNILPDSFVILVVDAVRTP